MINLFAFFSKDVLRITPRLIPAVGIKLNNEEKINNPLCKVPLNQEISPPTPNIQNSLPPSHYNLMMNVGACQARGRVAVLVSGGGGPANLASNNPDTVSNGAEPRRCLPAATAPATDIISAAQHTTGRA